MSKFNVGDRVKVVEVPPADKEMKGLEGTVVPLTAPAIFLGFDTLVKLDKRLDYLGEFADEPHLYFDDELELVHE